MTHSLQELRDSLGRHADAVHDEHAHDRAALVRTRARRVRRQRLAGIGAAAAAAVVAATLAVVMPSQDRPQPVHRLLGMPLPKTLTSLGYTYAFEQGFTGGPEATVVRLKASDTPRLLTWGDTGQASLKITTPDDRTLLSHGDFRDFTVIPAGQGGTWTVYGRHTAAAVYSLTDARPAGVTKDGITFRRQVAGMHLVSAAISDAGDADVSGEVDLPDGVVSLAAFCSGGGRHTWVHVQEVDGVGSFGANCEGPVFDPGSLVQSTYTQRGEATARVRVWATDGQHGPVVDDPAVHVGFGYYWSPDELTHTIAGLEVSTIVEYDGHTWTDNGGSTTYRGTKRLEQQVPRGQLVAGYFAHTGGRVDTFLDGRRGTSYGGSGLGGGGTLGVSTGGTVELRIFGRPSPRARLALELYQRAD